MWQFIPATGKNYKLQQNWWFDQRRDIVASTSAALDYLQYIYEMHGDWHLALASYNWGEGAVGRAVAKNRAKGLPTDYLSLTMPGETRYYVPKLQAIKNIIAQPQLFGVSLDPIPNRPYFGTVERSEKMDIALAARLAEIPVEEFIALNPAYSRPVMPNAANSPLVLPAEKVQTFLDNLQSHEAQDKPLSAWLTHNLKKGETLDKVAARYGLGAARLKQLNGINARTRITPGFALLVPGKDAVGHEALAARLPQTPDDTAEAPPSGRRAREPQSPGARRVTVNIRKPAAEAGGQADEALARRSFPAGARRAPRQFKQAAQCIVHCLRVRKRLLHFRRNHHDVGGLATGLRILAASHRTKILAPVFGAHFVVRPVGGFSLLHRASFRPLSPGVALMIRIVPCLSVCDTARTRPSAERPKVTKRRSPWE
jgi:LysM repeat protein